MSHANIFDHQGHVQHIFKRHCNEQQDQKGYAFPKGNFFEDI